MVTFRYATLWRRVLVLWCCVWAVGLSACATAPVSTTAVPAPAQISVAEGMARTDTTGYLRAEEVREFAFPADHGPHPEYAVEWWYYTGNLTDAQGNDYGYQFTLFRTGLPRTALPQGGSQWRSDAVYMAHLALSDGARQRFVARERFNRGALGLAGAHAAPFRVWLDDWSVTSVDAGTTQMRIQAQDGDIALDVTLDATGPIVLQGDRGLSQKSAAKGNASYYYSLPRMATTGTLRIGDTDVAVSGTSWMDREWSTSALGTDQVGWDWFALHLDDGSDIMLYQLRNRDGSTDPFSGGSVRNRDGTVTRLAATDIRWAPQGVWTSPHTGAPYPAAWDIELIPLGLSLTVTPLIADQELQVTVRYWEGAVTVDARRAGSALRGTGYLEMTGYADVPR